MANRHLGTYKIPMGQGPLFTSATKIPGGVFVGITMNEVVYRFIVEANEENLSKLRDRIGDDVVKFVRQLATVEIDNLLKKEGI